MTLSNQDIESSTALICFGLRALLRSSGSVWRGWARAGLPDDDDRTGDKSVFSWFAEDSA